MFPPPAGPLAPYSQPQVTGNLIAPSYPLPISQPSPFLFTGLTLTVTAGEDVSRVLRFNKSETPVINIGRMPSSRVNELELDLELDLAWFRCAVVSRKHAKICFADSGHVSIPISPIPPCPIVAVTACLTLSGLSHRSIFPSWHPLAQGRAPCPSSSHSRSSHPSRRRRCRHFWKTRWQGRGSRSSRHNQGRVPASAGRPSRSVPAHPYPKIQFRPFRCPDRHRLLIVVFRLRGGRSRPS